MFFLAPWIATLLILTLVTLALGLLLPRKETEKPSLTLTLATGFALLVTFGSLLTNFAFTAKFTTPIVLILTIATLVWKRRQAIDLLRNFFEFAILKVSYLLAGLPILATLKVGWPGWVQLDDTATFLAITKRIMTEGHTVPAQILSTYDRTLQVVLGGSFYGTYDANTNTSFFSYPVGSLIPLGVTGQISRIDLAWLYFPYLAFCIGLTAALFYLITKSLISNRWLAATAAIISAHAATFYAYALWGGIKEVSLVPMLTFSLFVFSKLTKSNLIPILLSIATIYSLGGKSGIGFILAEIALYAGIYFLKGKEFIKSKKLFIPIAVFALLLFLLRNFISDFFNKYLIPEIPDSGNLARPLNFLQILGVWPSGDFRGDIYWRPFSYIALALIIILVAIGLWRSIQNDKPIIAVGLITTLAIVIYSSIFSGIWLTGKAIAVASPFFLLAAFLGSTQIFKREKLKNLGYLSMVFILLGVGTSNYLAYRHTWLAPSEKVQELQKIGKEFKGQGPALMTEYAVFGARYFLRELQAESASELRVNLIPMRDGKELQKGFAADIDLFDNKEISRYNLLVLKHTSSASRPLFNYDLAFEGKYYDVWRKNKFGNEQITSIPLGNNYFASEKPSCSKIKTETENASSRIYAAERRPNFVSSLSDTKLESNWIADQGNPGAVFPTPGGYLQSIVEVDKTADYQWFIAGSYPGKLKIYLDQEEIFTGHSFFEGNKYLSNYLFTSKVTKGKHLLEIRYTKPLLRPGAGVVESLGPISLADQTAAGAKMISVSKNNIEDLCRRNLDWIAWVKK